MKPVFTILAMLIAATPATAQTLEVGRIKWDALPTLKIKDRWIPAGDMVVKVEEILKAKECTIVGQSADDFDITVQYALHIDPNGKTDRILVSDIGCRPIESLVGGIVAGRVELGDVLPTGKSEAMWYGSKMNFTLQ
jgi:hypothetical protein